MDKTTGLRHYPKLNGKSFPAMLVIARDHSRNIKAVQATYLNSQTATKIDATEIAIQKQTFGVMKGATVTLSGNKNAPTLIAEGIETGLSLKQALPHTTVKITLSKSNFKNIETRSLSQKTLLCLDQDGKDFKEDKLIFESAKRLMEANKQVMVMAPEGGHQQKKDYNDVLKAQGVSAIQADFDRAISAREVYGKAIETKQNEHNQSENSAQLSRQLHSDERQKNRNLITAYHDISKDYQQKSISIPIKQTDFEQSI